MEGKVRSRGDSTYGQVMGGRRGGVGFCIGSKQDWPGATVQKRRKHYREEHAWVFIFFSFLYLTWVVISIF